MVRGALAGTGVLTFVFALAIPFIGASHPRDLGPVRVAAEFESVSVQGLARGGPRVQDVARPEVVAGRADPTADPVPEPTAEPTPAPTATMPPAQAVLPALPDPPTSGVILASWYGPGFYGNRTACGQTYSPEIVGVAHRTLPCGTPVTLSHAGRLVTVPVIDRGPFIAGRTLDLSNATRLALACPDLCTLSMRIGP